MRNSRPIPHASSIGRALASAALPVLLLILAREAKAQGAAQQIDALCPAMASVRSANAVPLTLNVFGAGFNRFTQVTWNGTPVLTTFVSATQLAASVPAILLGKLGPVQVSAMDVSVLAANSQLLTNNVTFLVAGPPAIAAVQPNPVTFSANVPLVILGQNFIPGMVNPPPAAVCGARSTLELNGRPVLAATVDSTTQITLPNFPKAYVPAPGTEQIAVVNEGGVSSNTVAVIVNPDPSIAPVALPSGVAGLPYPATQVTVSGGTAPFTWTLDPGAPGLTITPNGANTAIVAGVPAQSGTFAISAHASDAFSVTASTAAQVAVLPAPSLSLTLPATSTAQQQTAVQITPAGGFPLPIAATLQVSFAAAPEVKVRPQIPDPALSLQFSSVTVDPKTGAVSGLQVGTTAGTITVCATALTVRGFDLSGLNPVCATTVIPATPPMAVCTAQRSANGIRLAIAGSSSTREVTRAVFLFAPASGRNLQTTQLTRDDAGSALFAPYYSAQLTPFLYEQDFVVNGNMNDIGAIRVVLENAKGASDPIACF